MSTEPLKRRISSSRIDYECDRITHCQMELYNSVCYPETDGDPYRLDLRSST